MNRSRHILPLIVFSQFCCTSLWFAGNGVMGDLVKNFNLDVLALGHLTASVQFGFIVGTFLFALLTITDRFSPSKVFFVSAMVAAIFNWMMVFGGNTLFALLLFRFFTGFFLAGIYPVGMKIASDYYEKGLGRSLGYLVGALVIGTSFPHLLKGLDTILSWKWIISITSALSILGGVLMILLVPNGPYRKPASKLDFSTIFKVFKGKDFRSAAFGYFGHMWELYAFWAFVPVLFSTYNHNNDTQFNVGFFSFLVIAVGGLACVISGNLSEYFGAKRIATLALTLSCVCCLLSPLLFTMGSSLIFVFFLIFWGMVVIADSPLFSTLVAQNVLLESKGTALTIVNSVGFAITIISIQLLNNLIVTIDIKFVFMFLAIGPAFGLFALCKK